MDFNFYLDVIKTVFLPFNVFMATFGVVIGIIFGALPGFTAAMGIAILMPITFSMTPEAGLIMMGALFAGAMWGGSVSAILINTPGTPGAAATVLDGYPMAKQGRAADALRESVMSSFWGGILGVIVLQLFAPPLAKVSLMFGPPEYFHPGDLRDDDHRLAQREDDRQGVHRGVSGDADRHDRDGPAFGRPPVHLRDHRPGGRRHAGPRPDRTLLDPRGDGDHPAPRLEGGADPQPEERQDRLSHLGTHQNGWSPPTSGLPSSASSSGSCRARAPASPASWPTTRSGAPPRPRRSSAPA